MEVQRATLKREFGPRWRIWWSDGRWQAYRYSSDMGCNVHKQTAAELADRLRVLDGMFGDLAALASDRVAPW